MSDWARRAGGLVPPQGPRPQTGYHHRAHEAAAAQTSWHTFSSSKPCKFIISLFRGQRPSKTGWFPCSGPPKAKIKVLAWLCSNLEALGRVCPCGHSFWLAEQVPLDYMTEGPISLPAVSSWRPGTFPCSWPLSCNSSSDALPTFSLANSLNSVEPPLLKAHGIRLNPPDSGSSPHLKIFDHILKVPLPNKLMYS